MKMNSIHHNRLGMVKIKLDDLCLQYRQKRNATPTGINVQHADVLGVQQEYSELSSDEVERLFLSWKNRYHAGEARSDNNRRDEIPSLIRNHLRTSAMIVFPGGDTSQGAWEFGLLRSLPHEESEAIVRTIAKQAYEKLSRLIPKNPVILVCFGSAMHACGKRIASALLEGKKTKEIHVVLAENYYSPRLWCAPKELNDKCVVVLVDVVHSGGLMTRLHDACATEHPKTIIPLTVIDQSCGRCQIAGLHALWKEEPEKRASQDDLAEKMEDMRYFDPELSCSSGTESLSNGGNNMATQISATEPSFGDLLPYIEKTDALQADMKICGAKYPWVLDLLRLVDDRDAKQALLAAAIESIQDIKHQASWCIVYPAERSRRSGTWAHMLGENLQWPVIPIGLASRKHYRPLTEGQSKELGEYNGIIVADAAIRTGETLRSFVTVARASSPKTTHMIGLYAFDALSSVDRETIETELGVSIRSAYRFPLGPPTESVQDYCRNRLRNTLKEINDYILQNRAHPWLNTVSEYCNRKLQFSKPFKRKETPARDKINLALAEFKHGPRARLEQSRIRAQSGIVKHLDARSALGNPRIRMAIHGFLCNSMPPEFIEWCGLALSSQHEYDWFDRDWLLLHQKMLRDANSRRWEFLACILFWMRTDAPPIAIQQAKNAIESIKDPEVQDNWLFDVGEEDNNDDVFELRRKQLLSILT